jgi:hypothetical protein
MAERPLEKQIDWFAVEASSGGWRLGLRGCSVLLKAFAA